MPRGTLIPQRAGKPAWSEAVILDIPITRTNPDALKTLATIFHGPPQVCQPPYQPNPSQI